MQITDFQRKQLLTSIHRSSSAHIVLYHYFRALAQSVLNPRYALIFVQPVLDPTLTAYAAVTLHLPSDFALLFDVDSLSKRKPSDLEKHIVREPLALNPLAGFSSLFPFVVIIIPHFRHNVNSFFGVFRKICAFLTKERNQHIFLVFLLQKRDNLPYLSPILLIHLVSHLFITFRRCSGFRKHGAFSKKHTDAWSEITRFFPISGKKTDPSAKRCLGLLYDPDIFTAAVLP